MRFLRAVLVVIGVAACTPSVWAEPGLSIGAQAPAFELVDQVGETRTREQLSGDRTLALLFYRSADW